MSEWRFIWAGYILTWVTLVGYAVYLLRRRARAVRALPAASEESMQ